MDGFASSYTHIYIHIHTHIHTHTDLLVLAFLLGRGGIACGRVVACRSRHAAGRVRYLFLPVWVCV